LARLNDTNLVHPDENNVVRSGENVLYWRPVFCGSSVGNSLHVTPQNCKVSARFLKIIVSVTHLCYIRRPRINSTVHGAEQFLEN
jgi:hypothetical protein